MPFLNIIGEKDHIVPPGGDRGADVARRLRADVEELRLKAGHVGLVVGSTAQRRNIPAMADWLEPGTREPAR